MRVALRGASRSVVVYPGMPLEELQDTLVSVFALGASDARVGAAANIGGIDAILNGRSGSWEADGVRQLLFSTVGADEAQLWAHRTDPIEITLYVDELVIDRAYEAISHIDWPGGFYRRDIGWRALGHV